MMADSGKGIYGGDLTGGSLLLRESRMAARMLVEGLGPDAIKRTVMDGNLFQNGSPATTRKYCRLVLVRLRALNARQLRIVADGADESAALMLLAAVLKTYPIVRDFVREVMLDKVRCFEPRLTRQDWTRFLEQRETIDTGVKAWTESSRRKIGQVIVRMLTEAGLLSDTRRMAIQFPCIPPEVAESLIASSDGGILECLQLGKAA